MLDKPKKTHAQALRDADYASLKKRAVTDSQRWFDLAAPLDIIL
jgi:hypothetical protein